MLLTSRQNLRKFVLTLTAMTMVGAAIGCKPRKEKTAESSTVKADTYFGTTPIDLTTFTQSSFSRSDLEADIRRAGVDPADAFQKAGEKYRALGLSLEEAAAVYAYTDTGYAELNNSLREENAETLILKYSTLIKAIASGINRLTPYKCTAYRFVNFDQKTLNSFAINARHVERAFVSTTKTSSPIGNFFDSKSHAIIIESDKCHSIENASKFKHEQEILFAPGSEFRVTEAWKQYSWTINNHQKVMWTIKLKHIESSQNDIVQKAAQSPDPSESGTTSYQTFENKKFVHSAGESWEFRPNYQANYVQGGMAYQGRWEHDGNSHIKVTWSNNTVQWVKIYSTTKIASIRGDRGSNNVIRAYELAGSYAGQANNNQQSGSFPRWMTARIDDGRQMSMLLALMEVPLGRLKNLTEANCYKPSSGFSLIYCIAKTQNDVNFLQRIEHTNNWQFINPPNPSQYIDD